MTLATYHEVRCRSLIPLFHEFVLACRFCAHISQVTLWLLRRRHGHFGEEAMLRSPVVPWHVLAGDVLSNDRCSQCTTRWSGNSHWPSPSEQCSGCPYNSSIRTLQRALPACMMCFPSITPMQLGNGHFMWKPFAIFRHCSSEDVVEDLAFLIIY